jgi:RNA polymerase sigma factor (sigma-70 family)
MAEFRPPLPTYTSPMPAWEETGPEPSGRPALLATPSRVTRRLTGNEIDDLVSRIRAGDDTAWEVLVRCLSPALYRGIGAFILSTDARDDVLANTWVKLLEHIDRIDKPASLVSWLMTTARNEARQFVRSRGRQVPVADVHDDQVDFRGLDESLLEDELSVAVSRAFQNVSVACQKILRLLTLDPPLSYAEIIDLLGLPHGSIGPTRGRCLDQLRRRPELAPFIGDLKGGGNPDD